MTEEPGNDKYIKCSQCKCKYIHDDEHIINEFGYNRLVERFKTCVKCRLKRSAYTQRVMNSTKDNHQTCTTCFTLKQVSEFTENDTQYKLCNPCRNKPKQKLLALK